MGRDRLRSINTLVINHEQKVMLNTKRYSKKD